jgi:glycosyltransferase involved in cell wall biosynthesis
VKAGGTAPAAADEKRLRPSPGGTRPRRILLYNDSPQFGGHEVMSAQVANELASRNEVVYFHANEELSKHLQPAVRSFRIPFRSAFGTLAVLRNLNPKEVRWLGERFAEQRPDLVLIVQGSVDLSLRGALAARRRGMKTVSYLPMSFPRREMGLRGGFFFDRYVTLFYRLFDAFIAIAPSQREFIRSFAGPDKPVYVLDNCVPLDLRGAGSREIRDRDLRIGLVGRLEWQQKGLGHLIEVAASVRAARPDIAWVVVGDGPDRGRFERELSRRGLRDIFEFRGWIGDRDELYRSFDLLLLPSLFEGVPLVLLEALARAMPVLARLTPGTQVFQEYLPPTFLYRDAAAAVAKLENAGTLLRQFRECSGELREGVLQKHDPRRFAGQVHAIVAAVLRMGAAAQDAGRQP